MKEELKTKTEDDIKRKKCSEAVMAILEEYGYDLGVAGFVLVNKIK